MRARQSSALMSSERFPAASLRSQPDCSAPIAPRMTQLGNGSVRTSSSALPLGAVASAVEARAGMSAFDRRARRPVAMDDFDDTEPARIGRRDRQHRLLRGSQFAVPWSAGPHPDRWGRPRAAVLTLSSATASQARVERRPRLAGEPAARGPACTATSSCWRTTLPRPLSPSAAPGWPPPRGSAAASAHAVPGTSAADPR